MKPLLSGENQNVSFPLSLAISIWLLMDHFNVGVIWYGVYWTITVLWFSFIIICWIIKNVAKSRKTFSVDKDGKITIK